MRIAHESGVSVQPVSSHAHLLIYVHPFVVLHEHVVFLSGLIEAEIKRQGWLVNEKVRTRTYWLNRNSRLVSNPHKPKFISARAAEGLLLIPLLDSPPTIASSTGQMSAVRVNSPPGFVLYSDNRELGRFELPVYDDGTGTVIKVLLTPLTVTADAAIVAGYVYLLYWSGGRTDCY